MLIYEIIYDEIYIRFIIIYSISFNSTQNVYLTLHKLNILINYNLVSQILIVWNKNESDRLK